MFLGFLSNSYFLAALAAIIPSIMLGFLVYSRGEKNMTKPVFVLCCVAIMLWAVANYFSIQVTAFPLFWIRLVLFFAVFLVFMFFLLVHVFPEQYFPTNKKTLIRAMATLSAIAMLATVSPFVFKDITYQGGKIIPVPGPLIPLFALTIITLFILGGVELRRKLAIAKDVYREQVLYVSIGYTMMIVLLILTQFIFVVAFHNTFFVSWGPIFTLPFLVATTYAIFKHHLFNVKVIATEMLTFAIWIILFLRMFEERTLQGQILDGAVLLFVIVFGILLIKSVQDEVYQKEQLQLLSQAKTEFISIASHQLRTPLTAVKGYISLLLEGTYGKLAIKPEGVLKKVYASNERLSSIVEDLLNVSRMDQGRLIYNFVPTDLMRVLTEIVDELKITAEIKHVDLSFEKPDDPAAFHMQADTEKLHQAIGNLVDNALKYTPQGSVRVKIEKTSAVPQKIVVTVRDSGIGLNPEDKMKIFERFSRGREGMRVNTKGTGLGLFIAKSIVESHGGTLHAESAGRNKGSSFIVELPLNFQPPIGKK